MAKPLTPHALRPDSSESCVCECGHFRSAHGDANYYARCRQYVGGYYPLRGGRVGHKRCKCQYFTPQKKKKRGRRD